MRKIFVPQSCLGISCTIAPVLLFNRSMEATVLRKPKPPELSNAVSRQRIYNYVAQVINLTTKDGLTRDALARGGPGNFASGWKNRLYMAK